MLTWLMCFYVFPWLESRLGRDIRRKYRILLMLLWPPPTTSDGRLQAVESPSG